MDDILGQLRAGTALSAAQAEATFGKMMTGEVADAVITEILTQMAKREPEVDELLGVARVMRRHVLAIPAPTDVIDTCGTGGVGSGIFNVSTTVALVAAACGVPVCKHGNRSITSKCGSAEVFAALGVNIDAPVEVEARCLREANICFAFAPRHHPAMKHVAAIRKALGFATIFNLMGPLTNPAGARRQLVGVRSPELAEKILTVLVELGAVRALVVSGRDGQKRPVCELSVSGPSLLAAFDGKRRFAYDVQPQDLGLSWWPDADLEIASPEASAALVRRVLDGEKGAARDIVLMNAAAALWVAGKVESLWAGVGMAAGAIDSGQAKGTLERLGRISRDSA